MRQVIGTLLLVLAMAGTSFPVGYPDAAIECRVMVNEVRVSGQEQQPLEGALCEAYDKADACVSACHPDATAIVQGCAAAGACATGPDGRCLLGVDEASYYIAVTDTSQHGKHPAHDMGFVGYSDKPKQARLAFLKSPDGKIHPAKSSRKAGSGLWIYEPQFVIWEGNEEFYPFAFESDESWVIDVCLDPPEGYELAPSDGCVQQSVSGSPESMLFKVVEVGSQPDNVKMRMRLQGPGGERIQVLSEVGVRLTDGLARAKGLMIDKNGMITGQTSNTGRLITNPMLFAALIGLGLIGFAVDAFISRRKR